LFDSDVFKEQTDRSHFENKSALDRTFYGTSCIKIIYVVTSNQYSTNLRQFVGCWLSQSLQCRSLCC